jgi:hypothetical protein
MAWDSGNGAAITTVMKWVVRLIVAVVLIVVLVSWARSFPDRSPPLCERGEVSCVEGPIEYP